MKIAIPSFAGWRPKSLSIRHILLLITAGLTLMVALLSARDLYSSAQRLTRSYALRDAMIVSDQLFDATDKVSVERDLALAMLQAVDDETAASLQASLDESRTLADVSVSSAVRAIDRVASPELRALGDQLAERQASIRAMRADIDRALELPARRRDPAVATRWEEATTALMADVERLWIGYIAPFTGVDATITQHQRYQHALRSITDYTGRERSIIGRILSENVSPSAGQTADLLRGQGVLETSWRNSRLLAEQSGLYPAIEPAYIDAESHYATMHDMTRDMFYVPLERRRVSYPIGPDFWFELSSQAAESLAALREASRVATRRYLDGLIARTERTIAFQVAISLAAVLLCIASFWLIASRVIRPINDIVDALVRTMRGEPANFAVKRRNDEIGKLADVLEAFQRNVEEIQRTAAELEASTRALEGEVSVRRSAEEKAQAQLERLSLLHRISRAIGERQELNSVFAAAIGNVEDRLPADFACASLFDPADQTLTVTRVGAGSAGFADAMAMGEGARIEIDENSLSRCMLGRLVYEPDVSSLDFPFAQRLTNAGLKAFVAAPLQVESQVFGMLIVARARHDGFTSGECEFLLQLSEHVALAAHQAQLNETLQRAYDDLRLTQEAVMQQERLRALGQMASGIAHDINNALSPIALYTESLLNTEPALSGAGREKLEVVQRAISDASRTMARMNEFSRRRESEVPLATMQPNTLVEQVLDLTQARWRDMPQRRGESIEMRTELAKALPAIRGAENELREALTNLVFNAIDALPEGGVVTVRTRTTASGRGVNARTVHVEVEDNGVGMDEATRQRCLEPFFTTKGERGTGLGLAMVYGMIQRHGGDMSIESTPGSGTLVRLSFSAVAAAAEGFAAPDDARPRAPLTLLVIDDDAILLRALREVLETDGHVVTAAQDGGGGIAFFRAAQAREKGFDAVITDLGMPGLDGRRVAAAIKQTSPDTPVILLTGWGERLLAEEETPDHVDCVLSKPPKLRELRAALARCCSAQTIAKTAQA